VDDAAYQRRLAHALQELVARGLLKDTRLTPAQRFFLRLGRHAPPLEYAGFWRVFWLVGGFAGAIFVPMLWAAFAADPQMPGAAGLLLGLGSGALFGACFGWYFRFLSSTAGLSRWTDLDAPPPPPPDGTDLTLAEVEARVARLLAALR